MRKKSELPVCYVATTLEIIDGKWKMLIIRDLTTGPKRTGEFLKSLDGLTQKVLTQTLREMIDDGIVERIDYNEVPPHVEYQLTELGQSLQPIIQAMKAWGIQYKGQLTE